MMIAEYKLNIFDCHNIDLGSQNVDFGNQKQKYVIKLLSGLLPIRWRGSNDQDIVDQR